jgi:CheY-like chemotaxis protein
MANEKILIVDDDADFLLLIKKRIESWGYVVLTTMDSTEALRLLKMERPKIVILDYMMPNINGIERLRKIRQVDRQTAAIMFTAQPTMKAMEEAKGLNITAFVPKESFLVDTEKDLKIALDLISQGS